MRTIQVRLTESARGAIAVLEVVVPTRRSLLGIIQRLLFGMRVQIVQAESASHEEGLVERFHIVEFDGARIGKRRASAIRVAVRKAVREFDVAA